MARRGGDGRREVKVLCSTWETNSDKRAREARRRSEAGRAQAAPEAA